MDHVVYLDTKAKEMESILQGDKIMIIRGATGRKVPYDRVHSKDTLYFINNNAEGLVKLKADVLNVINSEKMSKEESIKLVEKYQDKLKLTKEQFKRWAGKRYLVLIEIENIQPIKHFLIDKTKYSNMDDWLLVEDINSAKK